MTCHMPTWHGLLPSPTAAAMAAPSVLGPALYRAMLRSARAPAVMHGRFRLPPHTRLSPALQRLPESVTSLARSLKPGRDQRGLLGLIRAAWRDGAEVTTPSEANARLDDAFRCMRALGELHGECEEMINRRAANADRDGVAYCVGEVLRHKKFGFRAVVTGWDRRPEADVSDWDGVVGLPSGADQPFYRMVPDIGDCVDMLGGPRDSECGTLAQISLALARTSPYARVRHLSPSPHSALCRSGEPRAVAACPSSYQASTHLLCTLPWL